MTVRHAVLPVGAVLVLGLGVYLFIEVRAQPAVAQADHPAVRESHPPPPPPPVAHLGAENVPMRPQVPAPAPPPVVNQQIKEPPPPQPMNHELRFGTDPAPAEGPGANPKFDAVMDEANKAYDRGEFDDAKAIAGKVLAKFPANVRMLRIMVSSSCIDGDTAVAQASYAKLPPGDQEQMKTRCARYGITFPDKP